MIGSTPMSMIQRGFDKSSRAVKNRILKDANRKTSLKSKRFKLKTNKKLRRKANALSRKGDRFKQNWEPLFWTVVACLFLIVFFYNYWWAIMLVLLALLVLIKIIFELGAIISNKSKPISQEMRKIKISRPKKMKKPLNPGDYYVV